MYGHWHKLWNAALTLFLPLVLLRLYLRGRHNPKYRQRWRERLGVVPQSIVSPVDTWVHAVSVGEVNAARPLIESLLSSSPARSVLVTTTTPTGSDQVLNAFSDRVQHCYAPYDLPFCVRRFLDRVRPTQCIIMETEIWPNTIGECAARRIDIKMVNVRISDRSFTRYQWVRSWMNDVLRCVNLFAAQSQRDATRLQALGAAPENIHITGNMKFDFAPPATAREIADAIRSDFGRDRPVVIAGSTREHEEERILAAFEKVRIELEDTLLVLVPRHPERFDLVAATAQSLGYNVTRRSEQHHTLDASVDVYLGDTMGELGVLYGAADVAFVGGSLVPTGGHNLLEACAMGRPVLFGPHTFNFREISDIVISEGAGLRVASVSDLADTLISLLNDADRRFAMGEAGVQLLEHHRGALQRTLDLFANEPATH